MGCSGLFILFLVLNVAHCLEIMGLAGEIHENITAVLGEDVYLSCTYVGESEIQEAEWKSQINSKSKRLAGFFDGKPFSRGDISKPVSLTNLTVKMKVSSVEVEGEYICQFDSEEATYHGSVHLTVVARPDIQILVDAETINGSHYQSVSCSAAGGRPRPQISWLVAGLPPSYDPFAVEVSESVHSNGTYAVRSILRFPTRLQDEDSVTCVVLHPSLPEPKLTSVRVETYARPNVSIKAEMVQKGGMEFWVVSCLSSGGRPDADIALALNSVEELQREHSTNSDMHASSVLFPATLYEGRNITCAFDHPTFTHQVTRAITLPSFYFELGINSGDLRAPEHFEWQEGQTDAAVDLRVTGNVPHYNVTCKKEDGPLPDGVELFGSSLTLQGPVELQHAGMYECFFAYHHVKATLTFRVTVKPQRTLPVPPTIRVDFRTEDGHRLIECSAADAVPAANMSWLLPDGVSGVSWFNFTSHNGSHSVRGLLLLPACSSRELTTQCVINHPAFEEPANRSITLPLCARPEIAINSSTEWTDGEEFTKVDCSVESVPPAATIRWHVGNVNSSISYLSATEGRPDGSVLTRSSARVLSSLYSGQNVTCTAEHPSLEAPERRTTHILLNKAPVLTVSLERQRESSLWLAVCDYRGGGGVGPDLAWVLPDNAKGQTSRLSASRLTYQFPLALHEEQDLTCVYSFEHGVTEKKTIHIPRYYISSIRVLNHTAPLQSRHASETITHRLALEENHHNQRVLLRVEGNVPEYKLICERSNGAFVQMERDAMVFQSQLTQQDEGLYSCRASFYHHTATVNIQVEVTSEKKQLALAAVVCISSALAITLILIVTLWVCCKGHSRSQYKKKESLSALTSLMQGHGSPEVKSAVTENRSNNAQMVSYSIVVDIKSTV
ncbi:uncharacterized protein si:ch211-149e23.4 [Pungitius pungitius]|uniref:uncharacterized protein si:ch211-149e23.4 n=1 Tax=Pungitius pungitius TaxID=134920 RepID=UPI002E148CA5